MVQWNGPVNFGQVLYKFCSCYFGSSSTCDVLMNSYLLLSEGKDLIVSIENKMEDLFNLESDIVDLAMSVDTRKTDAEETLHGNDKLPC